MTRTARGRIAFVALLMLLQFAIIYDRAGDSYFFSDDFYNFQIYQERGFARNYLLKSVFGQFAPGYRFVQGAFFEIFGVDYRAAFAIMAALSLASTALFCLTASSVGTPPYLTAALALVLIFLIQPTHVQLWWSNALHALPGLVAVLAAMWLLVRRPAERRGNISVAVCMAFGLLFFSKVLFASILLFGIALFLREREKPALVANAIDAFLQLRYVVAVCVIYLVLIVVVFPQSSPLKPTLPTLLSFLWLSISQGTAGAMLGLGVYGLSPPGSVHIAGAVAVSLLAAIAAASIWVAGRPAAILWGSYVLYLLCTLATVGLLRAALFGAEAGMSLRYNLEGAVFMLLMIAMSFSRASRPSPYAVAAVCLAAVGVASLQNFVAAPKIPWHWDTAAVRAFVTNMQRDLASFREPPLISDGITPEVVVPAWLAPFNTYRRFLPLFGHAAVPTEGATHRILPDGSVVLLGPQEGR